MLVQDRACSLWYQEELLTFIFRVLDTGTLASTFQIYCGFFSQGHWVSHHYCLQIQIRKLGQSQHYWPNRNLSFAVIWGHCHFLGSLWTDGTYAPLGQLTKWWRREVSPQWSSTEQSLRFWAERPRISWNLMIILSLNRVFELHAVVRETLTDAWVINSLPQDVERSMDIVCRTGI